MAKNLRKQGILSGLKIEKDGRWRAVSRLVNELDPTLRASLIIGQKAAAEKFKKQIISNIKRGGGTAGYFTPLSQSYMEWKQRQGKGNKKMFNLDGDYAKAVEVIVKGNRVFVGISPGKYKNNRDGRQKMQIAKYAHILEHGRMGGKSPQPARPLWKKTKKAFGGNKAFASLILWHVARNFEGKHGIKLMKR